MPAFDVAAIRAQFPILSREVHGKPLVYLDNAATAHKPLAVLDASRRYYEEINANIHRGTHHLSQLATIAHEEARLTVARHLNSPTPDEIIFTSGTTDSINLVASILGRAGRLKPGDEILLSHLEHHSNIVPWQMLCERSGATLHVIPVHDDGTLDLPAFHRLLTERTRVLALTHISNAFGTVNPVRELVAAAKQVGALTLLDGAQAAPHLPIDVQDLDVDFYAFSGHKVYAPTGIGVLYGRYKILDSLPPWRGGGEMIKKVSFSGTTYNNLPFRYEAGTPNIEGAIGLAAALDWINRIGLDALHQHEQSLIRQAAAALSALDGLRLYGPSDRAASLSFNIDGIHHYDLGTLLDQMGIAVRTGHHCCQPLMERFGVTGTIRASFAAYNTTDEVIQLAAAVKKAAAMLR
ncbi:MAG: cysteine desulfurase [Verrucomicrobia bacterium]|nr:cysteine desulfurase [Verrucomicrobiota bacterium]MDA1006783.1 cysteine desulfurase [Verrucomicrobiota bacterium]